MGVSAFGRTAAEIARQYLNAFYSLLGVSGDRIFEERDGFVYFESFLLPFGSFDLYNKLANISSEPPKLSTPFWEFQAFMDWVRKPGEDEKELSTPFWEFRPRFISYR